MQLSANAPKYFRQGLNVLLGLAFLLELLMPDVTPLLYPALVALAAAASMATLARQIPLQSVLTVAAITALIGGAAHFSSAKSFIPFGPIVFKPSMGQADLGFIPLTMPLLWIVAVYNARGVMRLILRPWRKTKKYGWWLMGLTGVLVVAFDAALEPFATRVKQLWFWEPTKIPINWQGASPMNFVGWFFVTLLILAFTTPWLIKKNPSRTKGPDYQPLIMWLGALLLFAVGSATAGLWLAVAIDATIAAITLFWAFRGAKW
jgi:uncharacterized membrane protein